jgi:hypothetical protein
MSTQSLAPVPDDNWKSIPVRKSRNGIMPRVFRDNDVLIGYSELHPHRVIRARFECARSPR